MKTDANLSHLLDCARKQGKYIRQFYAGAGSSMRLPQPLTPPVLRRMQSSVYFSESPDVLDETGEPAYQIDGVSVPI